MKVHSLPIIGQLLHHLDFDVKNYGLQQAMMNIVLRSKTKLVIEGDDEVVQEVLKNKPVVIVANHPYDSEEVALIASLQSRRDIYLVVNSHFLGVSPELDKHLIPVYIWHHVTDGKHKKFLGTVLHKLHPTPMYTPEEEHKRNVKSISEASDKVKKGGVVIIFPGRRSKDGHWFSGVGHLINGLGIKSDAYVLNAYIQGTSDLDYFRMLPFLGKCMRPITVSFAKPIKVKNIYHEDGKKIATLMEEKYNQWIKTI